MTIAQPTEKPSSIGAIPKERSASVSVHSSANAKQLVFPSTPIVASIATSGMTTQSIQPLAPQ